MRWILLATVVASVLLANVATILYGPPPLPWALVQAGWVGLLSWIVRRLFNPAEAPAD